MDIARAPAGNRRPVAKNAKHAGPMVSGFGRFVSRFIEAL